MTVPAKGHVLPDQVIPKKFIAVLGPFNFCELMAHPLYCRWLSKACKVFCSRGQHYVVDEPISQRPGRKAGKESEPPLHGMCWAMLTALREQLEDIPQVGNTLSSSFFVTVRGLASW